MSHRTRSRSAGYGWVCSTRMLMLNIPSKEVKLSKQKVKRGKGKVFLNGRNYRRVRGLRIEISPRHCASLLISSIT